MTVNVSCSNKLAHFPVTAIAALVRDGWLIPVMTFGTDEQCESCGAWHEWGYGLCDRFSEHAPAGSDCNRAERFLLRPSDEAMNDPVVLAALEAVIEDGFWE